MPDEDQVPEVKKTGATWADVMIHLIDAIRDIFNDWRTWALIAMVVILAGGWMKGSEVVDAVERWIHALKGTG